MSDIRTGGESAPAPHADIAGFWRRLVALFLDMLVLAGVGFFILRLYFDKIVALGSEGRLIGLAIAIAYFGVLNSRYGGGASVGKRLLGLRVMGRSGTGIGLIRSLLRAVVLTLPYFLNGVFFQDAPFGAPVLLVGAALALVVFGAGAAIIYLYIFNRRTRQSLHDLVAGTFVVKAKDQPAPVTAQIWRGHVAVALVLLLASLVALPAASLWPNLTPFAQSLAPLETTAATVERDRDVASAQVTENTTYFTSTNGPSTTTTTLVVQAQLRKQVPAEAVENRLAAAVLALHPDLLGNDDLSISVNLTADIGIWKESYGSRDVYTREQWRERLHLGAPAKGVEAERQPRAFRTAIAERILPSRASFPTR